MQGSQAGSQMLQFNRSNRPIIKHSRAATLDKEANHPN